MSALLSLIGVTKRYTRGVREVTVLDDVSLELEGGDFACVLGGRGEGKTTLLEIATGMRRPDGGRVVFAEKDIGSASDRVRSRLRRSEIACVWNRSVPVIHGQSVLDHVALPLMAAGSGVQEGRLAAAAMIERVGVRESIGMPVADLTDWERARVALAQACVRQPRLLVADELTDTLDLIERSSVLGLLQGFAREGVAVLMTAADAHGAVGHSRLFSLGAGRLHEVTVGDGRAPVPSDDPGEVVPFRREQRGGTAE
jgi:putative ABC transport system ATP-binding protein